MVLISLVEAFASRNCITAAIEVPAVTLVPELSVNVVEVSAVINLSAGTLADVTYMPIRRPVVLATVTVALAAVVVIAIETVGLSEGVATTVAPAAHEPHTTF